VTAITPSPTLLSTMNDVPGYQVVAVNGEVFGLVVRSRNLFSGRPFTGRPPGFRRQQHEQRHLATGVLGHRSAVNA
jgi:uncharacterized protein YbjQ (UPF0145 family)